MHVLVTGGAGYLGSRVTAALLRTGHSVRVFDRLLYGAEALLALNDWPTFELVRGDVRDAAAVGQSMQGIDAIIHLAAIVGEPACNVNRPFAWSINHDAMRTVLRAAEDAGLQRLVAVSTCSNYGVAQPNSEVDEDAPLHPIADYAEAKVAAEREVLSENGVPIVTVLRLGTLCGVSARMRFDLLVNEMARDAALGRQIEIFAPSAWRPFLHIDDAADAIGHVLEGEAETIDRSVFNVVGENHQKSDLVEMARCFYPGVTVAFVDRKPDLRDYRVSGARIEAALGFRARRSVSDAFREVATAVDAGMFRDPDWPGHSALPLDGFPESVPVEQV
jgi:nucleoside-diphosphate-sugar epimerase